MIISLTVAVATTKPLHASIKSKSRPPSATNVAGDSSPYSSSDRANNLCLKSNARVEKQILDMGIGLLAASVLALSPLEAANATRIEYYATVAEPSCELNFVRSGLGYCDIAVGSGEQAPYNELIDVHYTARFANEIVFDSSFKRGRPLTMRIGVGKVIKGLDQGIFGGDGVPPMQVGGKRKLRIPPELGYGPEPAGCFSGLEVERRRLFETESNLSIASLTYNVMDVCITPAT